MKSNLFFGGTSTEVRFRSEMEGNGKGGNFMRSDKGKRVYPGKEWNN